MGDNVCYVTLKLRGEVRADVAVMTTLAEARHQAIANGIENPDCQSCAIFKCGCGGVRSKTVGMDCKRTDPTDAIVVYRKDYCASSRSL